MNGCEDSEILIQVNECVNVVNEWWVRLDGSKWMSVRDGGRADN